MEAVCKCIDFKFENFDEMQGRNLHLDFLIIKVSLDLHSDLFSIELCHAF